MRIIVTGLVGQYAFGGVAWDYLQFVEGFRQLGHDVFYLEDTEMWPYDPIQNTISEDCTYNVNYLRGVMEKLGLADRWMYRSAPDASYHGRTEAEAKEICATADFFLNVSGCGWLRPEYLAIPHKAFLDSDPMFTQVALAPGNRDVIRPDPRARPSFHVRRKHRCPDCQVPHAGFHWIPTRQPVVLDWWNAGHSGAPRRFHHGDELGFLQELRIQRRNLGTERHASSSSFSTSRSERRRSSKLPWAWGPA